MHAAVWPEVLETISRTGVRNYSIYRYQQWLFSYFELPEGITLEHRAGCGRRMKRACAGRNRCKSLQEPLPESEGAGWWVPCSEVSHIEGVEP